MSARKLIMKSKLLFLLGAAALILPGCHIVTDYEYDEADKYSEYVAPMDFVSETGEFNKLSVGWLSGDISIIEGDAFHVEETNLGGNYLPLYYYVKGSEVKLQYCKSGIKDIETNSTKKKLEITIPHSLTSIELDIISANYAIEADELKDIKVDIVSGNGEITLNSLETLDSNGVSGSVTLHLNSSLALKSIDIDVVSGNGNLYFDGVRGYDLSFSSISGKVKKEFEEGEDTSLSKFSIKYDSVSGNLLIGKNQ